MIEPNNYNYSTSKEINETLQFASELKLSVLPVIPEQDANKYPQQDKETGKIKRDKDSNPLPLFTGKNPSYFNSRDEPRIVSHKAYQDNQPTYQELSKWFANPETSGIGVLGSDRIILIDVDTKHFESVQHCEQVVEQWMDKYPALRQTWIERTRSGGYRIVVIVKSEPKFTNFQLEHYSHHTGEAIGKGRFAVIAPTEGYTVVRKCKPIEIDSLESIGVLAVSQPSSNVSIYTKISRKVNILLNGQGYSKDRSQDMTIVIKELYGWKNKLELQGKNIEENIDDIIQNFAATLGIDDARLERILQSINLDACVPAKEFCSNEASTSEELEINPNDPEGVLANLLANKFSGTLVFCNPQKSWFYYDSSRNYWVSYEDSQTEGLIMDAIDENTKDKGMYSSNKIAGIRRLLKPKLSVSQLATEDISCFLPLQNGLVHLPTKQLYTHHPKYGFTYLLPYRFDKAADCQPIKKWLLESTGGDGLQVEVLRAYLNAILKSRTDLQRYLEIIGVGGSGKSTYVHLAEALVGFENSFSTKLEAIEGNRFEVAGIIGKKLVTINDSEAYGGSVSTLKAITGQDAVRLEIKGKQQGDTFVPSAMVILTSNTSIRSSDYTSGLQRRRLTIHFNQAVSPENMRNLISLRNGIWSGEFVPCLPGLLNWVLEMSDQDVTRLVKDTSTHVPSLELVQREALRNSNPLAEWFDESVVFASKAKTYVGDKKSNSAEFLFNNYVNHCQNCGTNAVALNKFSNSVVDLCNNQLKQEVEKNKDNKGVYLTGIRLRKQTDINSPTPITGRVFNSPTEQQMEQILAFSDFEEFNLENIEIAL